jgi:hypothetical protein
LIVAGDCRDDDFLANQDAEWNGPWPFLRSRPYQLLTDLRLLRRGLKPEPRPQSDEVDHRYRQSQFEAAEAWVKRWQNVHNCKLDQAYEYVQKRCQHYKAFDAGVKRCCRIIFDDSVKRRTELIGLRLDREFASPRTARQVIDYTFFALPIRYSIGNKRRSVRTQRSTLGSILTPVLADGFTPDKTRPEYLDVRIKRADVLRLEKLYNKQMAVRSPKPPVPVALLANWYLQHVDTWPRDKMPPSRDEDIAAAKAAFPNHEVAGCRVRNLRAQHAPGSWTSRGRRRTKSQL